MLNIYSGVTSSRNIDPNLWQITFNELNQAVDNSFTSVDYNHPDFDFMCELKINNGVFSAFKNHSQTKALVDLLRDETGQLKSFSSFKKDAQPIIGKYNNQWLQAEYTTAVRSARIAANFRKYLRTADLYPCLEYLPSRAANPRQAHKPFYHIILPIDNIWWATHTPPLDWNCLCGITNTDAEPTDIPDVDIKAAPGLGHNPAVTNSLFSDTHPYFKGIGHKDYNMVEKACFTLMRRDTEKFNKQWAIKNIDPVKGLMVKTDKIASGILTFRRKDIKLLSAKAHKSLLHKNMLIPKLPLIFNELEYVGTSESYSGIASEWHYFKIKIKGEDSFLCVKKIGDEYRPHAITDVNISKYIK